MASLVQGGTYRVRCATNTSSSVQTRYIERTIEVVKAPQFDPMYQCGGPVVTVKDLTDPNEPDKAKTMYVDRFLIIEDSEAMSAFRAANPELYGDKDVEDTRKAPGGAGSVTPAQAVPEDMLYVQSYVRKIARSNDSCAEAIDQLTQNIIKHIYPKILKHIRGAHAQNAGPATVNSLLSTGDEPPIDELKGCPVVDVACDLWRGTTHRRRYPETCEKVSVVGSDDRNAYNLLGKLQTPMVLSTDPHIYLQASLYHIVHRIVNQVGYAPLVYGGVLRSANDEMRVLETIDKFLRLSTRVFPDPAQILPWTVRVFMAALPLDGTPCVSIDTLVAICGPQNIPGWPLPCAHIPVLLHGAAGRNAYAMVAYVYSTAYRREIPEETARFVALVYAVIHDGHTFQDSEMVDYMATGRVYGHRLV